MWYLWFIAGYFERSNGFTKKLYYPYGACEKMERIRKMERQGGHVEERLQIRRGNFELASFSCFCLHQKYRKHNTFCLFFLLIRKIKSPLNLSVSHFLSLSVCQCQTEMTVNRNGMQWQKFAEECPTTMKTIRRRNAGSAEEGESRWGVSPLSQPLVVLLSRLTQKVQKRRARRRGRGARVQPLRESGLLRLWVKFRRWSRCLGACQCQGGHVRWKMRFLFVLAFACRGLTAEGRCICLVFMTVMAVIT